MSKTIVLDIDGCLANFNLAYGDLFVKVSGEDRFYPGWRVDLQSDNSNFPTVWAWEDAAGYPKAIVNEVWQNHILQEGSKFWQTLEPLPGARETLSMLNHRQKKFGDQVWFVSTRMGHRAHIQTLEWLYNHGMDYPCLFFAADKVPYLRQLGANFFVDDRPETVWEMARVAGEEKWKDFQLFIKDAPYNRAGRGAGANIVGSVKEALQMAGLWKGI